jgi:DNA-binding transcriptional MerR regulator
MEDSVLGLSVKAASRMSGVSAHTLRAWERRYSVVEPIRTANGRRLYSLSDVEKLKLLGLLVSQGHSIGNLATLSRNELDSLSKEPAPRSEPPRLSASDTGDAGIDFAAPLLVALRGLDFEEVERLILRARLSTEIRTFVLSIVSPLLAEVGKLVSEHALDIAQEHALSAVLRSQLGEVLSHVQKATAWRPPDQAHLPTLLFSTPEGDLHEFGILLAAILAGSRGFQFRYLGPNMPPESLAKAATTIGAKIIVLGSAAADPSRLVRPLKEYIRILTRQLARHGQTEIWIGGRCDFDPLKENMGNLVAYASSLQDFDQRLKELSHRGIEAPKHSR